MTPGSNPGGASKKETRESVSLFLQTPAAGGCVPGIGTMHGDIGVFVNVLLDARVLFGNRCANTDTISDHDKHQQKNRHLPAVIFVFRFFFRVPYRIAIRKLDTPLCRDLALALPGQAHISAATRQFLRYLDRRNALEVPAGCTGFDNQARFVYNHYKISDFL